MNRIRFFYSEKVFTGIRFLNLNSKALVYEGNVFKGWKDKFEIPDSECYITQNVLMPGVVNAHHHLELSHLSSLSVRTEKGMPAFIRSVMKHRNAQLQHVLEAAEREIKMMEECGTVLCGDVSNTLDTVPLKHLSEMQFHTFVECIGYQPEFINKVIEKNTLKLEHYINKNNTSSLSAHAPYTVHPQLFKDILRINTVRCVPFSMHYFESAMEKEWIEGRQDELSALFRDLKIEWEMGNESEFFSPQRFFSENYFSIPSLLVHNTYLGSNISGFSDNVYFCFCPRSNLAIEQRLPDGDFVHRVKDRFCLGTDSLASSPDSSVWNEANVLLEYYSFLSLEQVMKALTFNGAAALGKDSKFGTFEPGKIPGLVEVNIQERKLEFLKKLI